jgi:hypothetical protein
VIEFSFNIVSWVGETPVKVDQKKAFERRGERLQFMSFGL